MELFCAHGMAEGVGFEPTVTFATPVFKTGALNHSTTLPLGLMPTEAREVPQAGQTGTRVKKGTLAPIAP